MVHVRRSAHVVFVAAHTVFWSSHAAFMVVTCCVLDCARRVHGRHTLRSGRRTLCSRSAHAAFSTSHAVCMVVPRCVHVGARRVHGRHALCSRPRADSDCFNPPSQPRPLLQRFGVSRAVNRELGGGVIDLTEIVAPEYSSPDHLRRTAVRYSQLHERNTPAISIADTLRR